MIIIGLVRHKAARADTLALWTWSSQNVSASGELTYTGAGQIDDFIGTISDPFGLGENITFISNPSFPAKTLSPTGKFIYDDAYLDDRVRLGMEHFQRRSQQLRDLRD